MELPPVGTFVDVINDGGKTFLKKADIDCIKFFDDTNAAVISGKYTLDAGDFIAADDFFFTAVKKEDGKAFYTTTFIMGGSVVPEDPTFTCNNATKNTLDLIESNDFWYEHEYGKFEIQPLMKTPWN